MSTTLLLVVSSACGEGRPAVDRSSGAQPPTTVPAPGTPPADSPTATCIRGGTTRAEVVAIMGEPDSVVFGAWIYGRSNVTFGYGVVLDFSNDGENLPLC